MASKLYINGKVFTGQGEDDFVSAFRITDGVFSWVGDQADVAGHPAVDLQGRTVVPGFLDVHTHPAFMSTLVDAVMCLPPEVNSLAGLLEKLRAHPKLGRGKVAWIQGFGYDESNYPEGRGPTADDLDLVSSTQPVFVCGATATHRPVTTAPSNSPASPTTPRTRQAPDTAGTVMDGSTVC